MMIAAPISGVLVQRVGPRWLVLASATAMTGGLLMLTQVDPATSTQYIIGALALFGLGGGLGLAPLTDTVMAAVPVNDAGIGSAVNDVSRELGAALGIATIGSVVNSLYRSNLDDTLPAALPDQVVGVVEQGVGVAGVVAEQLPTEAGAALVNAANLAFVDAMTTGFFVSAVFVALAAIIAVTLIPTKMRQVQAEAADEGDMLDGDLQPLGPALNPAPA